VGFIRKREESCLILINNTNIIDVLELELYNIIKKASKDGILESRELEKWCENRYYVILNWFNKVNKQERERLIETGIIRKVKENKKIKYYQTEQIENEAKQLAGLKKYLEEYTLIKDRQAIEIVIFEEYLIYAQIFGIAKKVIKEFKELYSELLDESAYNDVSFICTISYKSIRRAQSAKNKARERASTYSSGGGGFSSGGGRRRFIWPVAVEEVGGFR